LLKISQDANFKRSTATIDGSKSTAGSRLAAKGTNGSANLRNTAPDEKIRKPNQALRHVGPARSKGVRVFLKIPEHAAVKVRARHRLDNQNSQLIYR
jgi:hypothetical protein